jgi:predicted anti-sigma-YlaC factor YlaD
MDVKASARCERAREYASLALDGELSQFEHALLRAHLEACPGCRSYNGGLLATTERLRNAPLERLQRPITLPSRRRVSFRSVQAGLAAALVVTAVGLGGVLSSLDSSDTVGPPTQVSNVREIQERKDLNRVRLQEIATHVTSSGGLGLNTI